MSDVTNVILLADCGIACELKKYPKLKNFITTYFLERVDQYAGGSKCIERTIFMAGLNYVNKDRLIQEFECIEQPELEQMILMIQGQHDYTFEWHTREGGLSDEI